MAQKYGILPTEILQKATTHDFMIFYNANLIKYRDDKISRGESIADTYSQSDLNKMYYDFRE